MSRREAGERREGIASRRERVDRRDGGSRRDAGRGERAPAGQPARAHRFLDLSSTRRAAVLALVVCAVALSVAVPLRNYLAQRGALDDTVQQQEKLREQVDSLERRKAQLSDPAQVEVEARDRLRYVKPGETPYVVQLPSSTPAPPPPGVPRAAPRDPWYGEPGGAVQ